MDPDEIKRAKRKVFNMDRGKLADSYQSVRTAERESYHPHFFSYLQMLALDEELETCGVESVMDKNGRYWDYCNTGDTYCLTVIRNPYTGQFMLKCYGDLIEYRREFRGMP